MRLRLASFLIVSLSVPSFAATRVQLVDKAERGRDIGGGGERVISRTVSRPVRVRTIDTTAAAHAADAVDGGRVLRRRRLHELERGAAAREDRGRRRVAAQDRARHEVGVRGGRVPVRLLLPVSGHVDGTHADGEEVYVELHRGGSYMPLYYPTTRGEVAVHAARHGAGRFMAQPAVSVSAPFDATEALVHAVGFARDTRFRVAVGDAPARNVRATGLVTAVDLNLHLRRGENLLTMAPEGSGGVVAFGAGRSIVLER